MGTFGRRRFRRVGLGRWRVRGRAEVLRYSVNLALFALGAAVCLGEFFAAAALWRVLCRRGKLVICEAPEAVLAGWEARLAPEAVTEAMRRYERRYGRPAVVFFREV